MNKELLILIAAQLAVITETVQGEATRAFDERNEYKHSEELDSLAFGLSEQLSLLLEILK